MKNMNLSKYVATTLLVLISTWSAHAHLQADGVAAIKTDDGYLLVWNDPGISFTLELKGKEVRPMTRTETGSVAFNVDGVVLQAQSLAISEFIRNPGKPKQRDQAILLAHRDWESHYLEQALGGKLKVTSAPQKLGNGSEALLWTFDAPKGKTLGEHTYLTTVSGNRVIILNGTEKNASVPIPAKVVQELLLNTLSTLKVSSRPIDVLKLRESVRPRNTR
jgi:hypothetical protein